MKEQNNRNESMIEGRNAVLEAFRSGKTVDKLYILDGCQDGPVRTIVREAKKRDTILNFVTKERLDQLSETKKHQGVIAMTAAYEYSDIEEMFALAEKKGEDPFLILLDNIEDPHNLGAIIRTAEACGAHGVIIPKRHSAGLTAAAVKSSAGAAVYLPVVRVANIVATMQSLKAEKNVWFTCADMDGVNWCQLDFKGAVGLVIGSEGNGVSRLVKEECDFVAALPMQGQINSLNASVAGGIILYEITRQRLGLKAR